MEVTSGSAVLTSPRYSSSPSTAQPLFQHVTLPSQPGQPPFSAYWLCRGLSATPLNPAHADLVIYHLHGGGYVGGHPATFYPDFMFIAEVLKARGVSVCILSLEYTWAPYATFPVQLEQAVRGWEYLVSELGVDAGKVCVFGESAGGHLAVALLTRLALMKQDQDRDQAQDKSGLGGDAGVSRLEKPALAMLMSPWIDLLSQNPRASDRTDFLPRGMLHDTLLLRDTPSHILHLYTNFASSIPARGSWKDILPAKTWMSAGGDEFFVRDIVDFYEQAKGQGADVVLEVEQGRGHVWQAIESVINGEQKRFLRGQGVEGLNAGLTRMAVWLAERVGARKQG